MTMRKKYPVLFLALLLTVALCLCLFACEDGDVTLPQFEEELDAAGITLNLHDAFGPNTDGVRSVSITKEGTLSKSAFVAEYYDCIGVYDSQGTLLYDFDEGWNVDVFNETFLSSAGNQDGELDLWLHWQAKTIGLRFDVKGIDAMTVEYGASLSTLPVPDYEETDYVFDGWMNNGTLIANQRGEVLISSFDASNCNIRYNVVSLTARLVKKTSTVVFVNALQDKNVSKTFDYGYVLSAKDYPRVEEPEHREFVGWSLSPLEYVPQTESLRVSTLTFYAIWKKYTTLTFLDGEKVYTSKRVYEGETLNLETYEGLSREGYTVEGVYINPHFSGNAELSYSYGLDRVFYVRWEKVYDVTFYEGENNPIGICKVREGDKLAPHYYRLIDGTDIADHRLSGLYRSSTFDGVPVVEYSADQGISDLYVKTNNFCIFYHSNYPAIASLKEAVKTTYAEDGSKSAWASSHFRCLGWSFSGWATESNKAVKYANGQAIDETAQDGVIHLYAVWKVVPTEIGLYVATGSVVSDTDGASTYTVYNTIDSTPWSLADYAIVDWRNESDTVVGKHTKRVVNDKRYNNIDIYTNTKLVYFIGSPNKTFTDFQFHLVNYTSKDWLNVVFVNFRYETSSDGALKTWWASDHADKNANLRLTLIGENSIGSNYGSGDLIYQMTQMIVDGSGSLVLRAGKGANATTAGGKGGSGGVAIRATLLEVDLDAAGKLTVYGGAGGKGASGSDQGIGTKDADAPATSTTAGGAGGVGGSAFQGSALLINNDSVIEFYGGRGGAGGSGGNVTGSGSYSGYADLPDGASGGAGGNGGAPVNDDVRITVSVTGELRLQYGDGGSGGKGGRGGDAGWPENGVLPDGKGHGGAGGVGGMGYNGGQGGQGGQGGSSFTNYHQPWYALWQRNDQIGTTGSGGVGGHGGASVASVLIKNGVCSFVSGSAGVGGKGGACGWQSGASNGKTVNYGTDRSGSQADSGSNQTKLYNLEVGVFEFEGHRYSLLLASVNWDDAKAYCESLGGHLATITSREEQAFIETFVNVKCWLGATDNETEGTWKWVTGEAWSYTNWSSGQPDDANNEDYLGTFPQAWNDYGKGATDVVGFLCEWEPAPFNGHYYRKIDVALRWDDAKTYCESLGGYLATITSKEEDAYVQKLAPSGGCWVGATDREKEGTWKWITDEDWSYTNWGSGEPNDANGGEDALEFHSSYWNDNNESAQKTFICEWDS